MCVCVCVCVCVYVCVCVCVCVHIRIAHLDNLQITFYDIRALHHIRSASTTTLPEQSG